MRQNPLRQRSGVIPALTAALMAAGVLTNVQAQIQSAGTLFVNVDATGLAEGPLNSIPNTGTLGGVFSATGGATAVPVIATEGGTKGIRMDGGDYLQLIDSPAGAPVFVPEGLVGEGPTRSIEVWAFNPALAGEETLVSWGKRGGPEGSNMSFNYGSDFRWGAVGHWGNQDLGWNNTGGGPAAGRWHHLVYTFDGATVKVYADGNFMNGEYIGEFRINTHPDGSLLIGAQSEPDGTTVTGGLRFSGTIARVRVHDGVLTAEQVKANYDTEKAAFIDPQTPPTPPPPDPIRITEGPTHRYSFSDPANQNPEGAQFRDTVGSAHGVVQGAGARLTGSRLVLPGGPSATAPYGDLPNNLLSTNGVANGGSGQVTIETWARVTGGRQWSRLWDFGSSMLPETGEPGEVLGPGGGGEGRDYFMYSAQLDNNLNQRRLELRNEDPPGGGIVTVDNNISSFGSDAHVVVTWDEATGRIIAYENGVQVSTMTTDDKMSDINDVNVWLGRSNWTGDQNMQGEFDEFRIYDYTLSAGQVRGNYMAGPNVINDRDIAVTITGQPQTISVPDTAPATFRVAVEGSSPITVQWLRDGNPIPNATNLSFTISRATTADNNAQFTARVSNVVNGQPVTVTSQPATLTVNVPTVSLKHRYSFNEAAGPQVTDSVSGAHGAAVGAVAFGNGQADLDGFDSYIDLPNGILSGLGADGTIEMWITHQGTANWTRIFDFGVSTEGENLSANGLDFFFFTPRTGDGFPRFIANFPNGGDLVTLDPQPPGWVPAAQEVHVAISWSASGNLSRLFINGVPVRSGLAPQPISNMAGADVNNWLGRSQFVADAYWDGSYNEFRLYTGAMTPSQVADSFAAGPNNLPAARPRIMTQISGNNLVISYANAAGFVLESTTDLSSNNWTAVAGATATGATVPLDGRMRFFRLRRQ